MLIETEKKINFDNEIIKLKSERNAVILAHYYQVSEIQDIADFVGDSLELSKKAAETQADLILFAGVHFMAETAKILNPNKKVLIPDLDASCSLADGCIASDFIKFKNENPNHYVVSYINCSAEVKALSDVICTSSSAEKIINKIPNDKKIIFAPDKNLGKYLIKKTGRDMLLWNGSCMVHEVFSEAKILRLKIENPDAKFIAHPECEENILAFADFIGSTSAMLKFTQVDSANKFIVATESGILHQMQKSSPEKIFIPAPPVENCLCNDCPHMKKNTMEKIYLALKNLEPEIILNNEIIEKALIPIKRMLEMSN